MTLYALDDIEDAIDATREFLWPPDIGQWAKLALVVFFVGSASGVNPFQFSGGTSGEGVSVTLDDVGAPDTIPSLGGPEIAVIAAIIALVVLLGLVLALVGSIMEFIFVESLRREEVTLRRYWSEHWRAGVRLFGFRLALGILTFGLIALLVILALSPILFWGGGLSFGLLLLAIPLVFFVTIAGALVHAFTTVFVVPVMMLDRRGVISAWRRFWSTMVGQWKQYAVYAVMAFVLQLAGGILIGIATLVGAIVVAIPLVIVGLLGVGVLTVSQLAGLAVIALAVVLFVLAVIVLGLFVSVPVQTFLRYYALLVLGDTNESFDLIPDRRQAIRE